MADAALLAQALTHSSYVNENPDAAQESNERLEFLGDSVLGFIIADDLYAQWPQLSEGEMTVLRSQLVSTQALASAAEAMELGKHLRLGRGEEKSGGRTKPRNLAGPWKRLSGQSGWMPGWKRLVVSSYRRLRPGLKPYPTAAERPTINRGFRKSHRRCCRSNPGTRPHSSCPRPATRFLPLR